MDIKSKIADGFMGVQGGLFSKVTKADVGDGFTSMTKNKVTLMGWADPFYPDPSIPEVVKNAMLKAYESGSPSHYTLPIGSPELREEIAKKCKAYNKMDIDPKRNVIITPGSDSGLYYAMAVFINKGDEVLVTDPSYPSNFLNPKLLGGVTVNVPLDKHKGYQLDIDVFERAVTKKTKMVLITHPNNPTTTVFRREGLEKLAEFVCRHDLILVVDQAFEDMVFDNVEFVSPASLPGMWERTVTVCSISKGMGLSGFRVGYLVACDKTMDVFYGAAVNVLGATNTASQIGAIAAFQNSGFMEDYKKSYDFRRKAAYRIFNEVPGVSALMPESGFFSWIDVSRLGDSTGIMDYLVAYAKVAVNDGKNYGLQGNGYLRIIHGCLWDDEEAVRAMERIACALRNYKNLQNAL
jgi:Aspartate/tyrosine/aromatic aminotransferase